MWREVWEEKKGHIRTFYIGLFSGVLTGAACSVHELWWLVFVSLVPLCTQLMGKGKAYVRALWGYALGYYTIVFYWLSELASVYVLKEGMSDILIFIGILGISVMLGISIHIAFLPFSYVRRNHSWDIFVIAALYILAEWMQGKVSLIAFPWARLSIAVTPFQAWIQSASIFGGLGITGSIVLVNALLARLFLSCKLERAGLGCALLLIVFHMAYGVLRLESAERLFATEEDKKEEVLLVQGNHSGQTKWDYTAEDILEDYIRLSREGITENTKLIIWPETALPLTLQERQEIQEVLLAFCREYNLELLTGAFDRKEEVQYNAMFLVTPKGIKEEVYYKRYLVPFGEYIPYQKAIGNLIPVWYQDYMKDIILTPGKTSTVIASSIGNLGGIICYESIYADTAKDAVEHGAEYLIIISNDSWFGNSQALREHHAHAILRAVEEKRYVMRAGNTGITSVITPYGEVIASGEVYRPITLSASVVPSAERTIYSRIGDSIVWSGIALWGLGAVMWGKSYKLKKTNLGKKRFIS